MGDPSLPPKPVSADKLLAQRLEPLIADQPLKLRKRVLYYTPIGLYLRGYWLQKGFSNSGFFMGSFVHPLYAMTWADREQFGHRLNVPGGYDYWDYEAEGFDAKFTELLTEPVPRCLADLTTGAAFERFNSAIVDVLIRANRVLPDWKHLGRGWAALHRGDLVRARLIFEEQLRWWDTVPLQLDGTKIELPPFMETMQAVVDLLDSDPGAIPAHCDAVARQAIANLKMTNVWKPTPFQYTG